MAFFMKNFFKWLIFRDKIFMLHSVTFNYTMDISWKRFLWIMSFKRGEAKRNLSSFSDYSDQIVKG